MKSSMAQFDSPVMASCVKTFQPLKTTMMTKNTSAKYALYGWNFEAQGLSLSVTPCALQALRNWRKAMRMLIQVNNEVMVVSW